MTTPTLDDGVLLQICEEQIDWLLEKAAISRDAGKLALLSILMAVREQAASPELTSDEFRAACILDAREAYAAYESMQTVELLRLQIAHQLDQAHAVTPESIAFGGGRLALIAAVLKKRGAETRG